MATIYPCHLRRGKSADMTRQAVSTENRGGMTVHGFLNKNLDINKGYLSNTEHFPTKGSTD